jgi:hypothetical protein
MVSARQLRQGVASVLAVAAAAVAVAVLLVLLGLVP